MPIIVVTGKEIEKIKGDYESYLSGLNMVGEIDYSQYSQLYDEGTKQIQRAYELGKSELEKENAELEQKLEQTEKDLADYQFNYPTIKELEKENAELKEKLKPENCLKLLAKEGYIKFTSDQLTKAKEIIREFVEWATWQGSNCPNFKDIQDKAEQFISEVEK